MSSDSSSAEPLLSVRDLKVQFPIERGVLFKRQIGAVRAVDGLAFDPGTGTLYGSTRNDELITIDAATGLGAAVGPIGFDNVNGLVQIVVDADKLKAVLGKDTARLTGETRLPGGNFDSWDAGVISLNDGTVVVAP